MSEIRGEKVVFGKGDYRSLEAMPSTAKKDAIVLALPRRRSITMRILRFWIVLSMLAVIALGSLFLSLEEGYLDKTLTAQAEQSLSTALGNDFEPEVGAIRLRFSRNWMLAFQAKDVTIRHRPTGIVALKADSIKAVVDPIALLAGKFELARTEIGTAKADIRFLPAAAPIDWSKVRIDGIPAQMALVYPVLDNVVAALERANTEELTAGNITLMLPSATAISDRVELQDIDLSNPEANRYRLAMRVAHGKLHPKLTIALAGDGRQATGFDISVDQLAAEPLFMKYSNVTGERRYGLDLPLSLSVSSERDRSLVAAVKAGSGDFYGDSDPVDVHGGHGKLSLDFATGKIELTDGLLDLGDTVVPLVGTLVDLDRRMPGKPPGYAFEVIGNRAVASAEGSGEAPEHFNVRTTGFFLPQEHELQLDNIGIVTSSGNFAGSLYARFVKPSPAVTFSARSDTLSVAAVKQLWPFWFGKKARNWILQNITGGTVRNGSIDVSLAAGRIPEHPEPLVFQKGELHITFDADDTQVRFLPKMPGSVKTSGHFDMTDRAIRIDINSGELPLPSGRSLAASNGVFQIADISKKPVMASLSISASGEAAAATELTGFEPINALSRMPFAADDMTGRVKADISADFSIEKEHEPPKPTWNVAVDLDKVGFDKPIEGRNVANVEGMLNIDTTSAVLKGSAVIDGMRFDVGLSQPIVKDADTERTWSIDGKISDRDILKLAPSLAGYVSGTVDVDIESAGPTAQKARLSLTDAEIAVPIFGWRKGPGIGATAEFTLERTGEQAEVRDLDFSGDGFGAIGRLTVDKRGIVAAKFSKVRLSTSDDFAMAMQRKSSGLAIDVTGNSIDMRPFLSQVKSPSAGSDDDAETKESNSISARLDRVYGFNNETMSAVDLTLATRKGSIADLKFSGVTRSGQAVVVSRNGGNGAIEVTSGDAGQTARFADIYGNMNGGLLNVTLKQRTADSWRGSIDVRNFALVNEDRLKSIVSARSGRDGRSLTDAVKKDIDVTSQKFRRGFARLMIDGKVVRVDNGIVRGDEVGATFQGVVRDQSGNMNLTGTFMPAYGLNRLFGELPLIGDILGNGRDRGLVGITFKLEGPFDKPRLAINPLSLIAPGVFRNIFEFE